MWRSLFIALGIMAIIIGFETLLIESATFYTATANSPRGFLDPASIPGQSLRTWNPSEIFPWLVLSIGALVVIYAFTLPKRFASQG